MVVGVDWSCIYRSQGLREVSESKSTCKGFRNGKCDEKLFNFYCIILDELFGVILNIGFLCNFCKTHPFDMVVGVDWSSIYLSQGLCEVSESKSTCKRLGNGKFDEKVVTFNCIILDDRWLQVVSTDVASCLQPFHNIFCNVYLLHRLLLVAHCVDCMERMGWILE